MVVLEENKSIVYIDEHITIDFYRQGEKWEWGEWEIDYCKIKEITDIPVAVLTNGSLLWLPEVRNSLMAADLVLPSLDAGSDQLFRYINPDFPNSS